MRIRQRLLVLNLRPLSLAVASLPDFTPGEG